MNAKQAAPYGNRNRISADSAWPLRAADGRTFAEGKAAPLGSVRPLPESVKDLARERPAFR